MKNFCFVDNDISDEQVREWKLEFKSFIKEHLEITPTFHIERWDFDTYPTFRDSDNDLRPTASYLKSLSNHVEETYGDSAFDHVFIFIAEKNWRSGGDLYRKLLGDPNAKGIWGTNYSMVYGNLHLHYCRWDERNMANTFGTAYHEWTHSLDSLVKVETGVNVAPLIKVDSYDRDMTHGAAPHFDYIQYKENTNALKLLQIYIREAYDKRRQVHLKRLKNERDGLLRTYLGLLRRKLRILLNKKNGVRN